MATEATRAWLPSPPAMPMTSAPPAMTSFASCRRSSPGSRTTGSMPLARHSSTRWNRPTLPPPDFGFIRSTPRLGAGAAVRGVAAASGRVRARRAAPTDTAIAARAPATRHHRTSTEKVTATSATSDAPPTAIAAHRTQFACETAYHPASASTARHAMLDTTNHGSWIAPVTATAIAAASATREISAAIRRLGAGRSSWRVTASATPELLGELPAVRGQRPDDQDVHRDDHHRPHRIRGDEGDLRDGVEARDDDAEHPPPRLPGQDTDPRQHGGTAEAEHDPAPRREVPRDKRVLRHQEERVVEQRHQPVDEVEDSHQHQHAGREHQHPGPPTRVPTLLHRRPPFSSPNGVHNPPYSDDSPAEH